MTTILTTGPVKLQPTPRRVRDLFDTTKALNVLEHKWFPDFWIPVSEIAPDVLTKGEAYGIEGGEGKEVKAFKGSVKGREKSSDGVVVFEGRVCWGGVD